MKGVRVLALPLMTLFLATCGGDTGGSGPTAVAKPPRNPPVLRGENGRPPPAWIETARGRQWLGYSSFCWGRTCADYIPPRCGDPRTPTLRMGRGDLVRFHLGFEPTEVSIQRGLHSPAPLKTSPAPTWRVRAAGTFRLFARAKSPGGNASYVACVRFA